MKFTIDRKALYDAVQDLAPVTPKKSTLPITACILLTAEGRKVTLAATNLEQYVLTELKASVQEPGAVAIMAAPFRTLLQALQEARVTVTFAPDPKREEIRVLVETDTTESTLEARLAEDFLPVPEAPEVTTSLLDLPAQLARIEHVMARDDARPVLTGMSFRAQNPALVQVEQDYRDAIAAAEQDGRDRMEAIENRFIDVKLDRNITETPAEAERRRQKEEAIVQSNALLKAAKDSIEELRTAALTEARTCRKGAYLELAAADGFRLGVVQVELAGQALYEPFIVPGDTIRLIMRLMKGTPVVTVSHADNGDRARFEGAGYTILTQLIRGQFPNYQMLIPEPTQYLSFHAEEVRKALKMLAPIAQAGNGIVRLEPKGDLILVSSFSNDTTSTAVKLRALHRRATTHIAFNHRYLQDLFSHLEGRVNLGVMDPGKPGMVRQNGLIYIIIPMFVQW